MAKKGYDLITSTDDCFPAPDAKSKLQTSVSFSDKLASYDMSADLVGADQEHVQSGNASTSPVKGSGKGSFAPRGAGHRFSKEYK